MPIASDTAGAADGAEHFGAVVPPLYLSTTFVHETVDSHRGYAYSRAGNPTRSRLEDVLARLEGARYGAAFSSGLAAAAMVLDLVPPGAGIVAVNDLYGGTYRLLSEIAAPRGHELGWLDVADANAPPKRTFAGAGLVWLETPTNPLLEVVDIAAVAAAAREAGALVAVDSTFASPVLQRPLAFGADLVVHSTTKYIGGHSDVVGGFVATDDPRLGERLAFLQKAIGAVPSPFDAWLLLRSLKTLPLRVGRQCENAAVLARFLVEHPSVGSVFYPGLEGASGHRLARRQMDGFGGMLSFTVADGDTARRVCEATEVFHLAESLGSVESLIEHPARMTHASAASAPFAPPENLVRLSVGIEDVSLLVADLDQALARA